MSGYNGDEGFFRVELDFPDDTLGDGAALALLRLSTENSRFNLSIRALSH
jgi:hypothetical protein